MERSTGLPAPNSYKACDSSDPGAFLTWDEAMASPCRKQLIKKAATKEITELKELVCWEEAPIYDDKCDIALGAWVFTRIKHTPDGEEASKFNNSCFCICAGNSKRESLTPVCQSVVFFSFFVCILQVLAQTLGWPHT